MASNHSGNHSHGFHGIDNPAMLEHLRPSFECAAPHTVSDVTSNSFTLAAANGTFDIGFNYDPTNEGAEIAGRDPARLFVDLGDTRLVYVCTKENAWPAT